MEHKKSASGLGHIRGHLEVVGIRPYNFCGVLHSSGTGGDNLWVRGVGLVRGHGEADSGVLHSFFAAGDGEKLRRQRDKTWRQEGAKSVLKVAGTQDIRTYIERHQVTVAQLVELHPIFEVCVQETR